MNHDPLRTRNPLTGTFPKSEDPDEMPHNAAFYQGLHCLLRPNQSSEKEIYFWEFIILINTMNHPNFII